MNPSLNLDLPLDTWVMSGTLYDLSVSSIQFLFYKIFTVTHRFGCTDPVPSWVVRGWKFDCAICGWTISALESNGVVACTGHTHRLKETFIIKICHLCKMRFITALSLVSFTEHGARFYEAWSIWDVESISQLTGDSWFPHFHPTFPQKLTWKSFLMPL